MEREESELAIAIEASGEEVRDYISTYLSDEEAGWIKEVRSQSSSKMPGRNRAIDPNLPITVIEFVAISVAGGVTYDVLKELTKKIKANFQGKK